MRGKFMFHGKGHILDEMRKTLSVGGRYIIKAQSNEKKRISPRGGKRGLS